VQQYGTGALNIDGCRVECDSRPKREVHALRDDVKYAPNSLAGRVDGSLASSKAVGETSLGRWPADIIHDGSDEVLEVFPQSDGQQADVKGTEPSTPATNVYGEYGRHEFSARNDSGSAARFFYTAKASKAERDDGLFEFEEQDTNKWNAGGIGERRRQAGLGRARNTHPTVKPLDLMRWLVRLVTPPDGVVLDPFCGSGTTLKAARAEGHKSVGIDLELEHCEIAWGRLSQGVLL
jgi:site-specific DNA-methyltransferase (adenine-specific)